MRGTRPCVPRIAVVSPSQRVIYWLTHFSPSLPSSFPLRLLHRFDAAAGFGLGLVQAASGQSQRQQQ